MTDTYVTDPASGKSSIVKDPTATLDYPFDWTAYLADVGDTIASAMFTITGSATAAITAQSNTTVKAVAWIAGGAIGDTVKLNCKITTTSTPARLDDRSVYIKIKAR
jgi:hypothetical protein